MIISRITISLDVIISSLLSIFMSSTVRIVDYYVREIKESLQTIEREKTDIS